MTSRLHLILIVAICITLSGLKAQSNQRQKQLLDTEWSFHLGEATNAQQSDYDDANWRSLDLPHDWSIEGDFDQNAVTTGRGGYLPTGVGWYRKVFDWRPNGNPVWIEFGGIYQNSDVWINGHHLGHYPNGYMSFYYDLTPHLVPGQNTIAVRVDNSLQPNTRWYSGSGIYRHVWLHTTHPLHVAPWGTYVTTPVVDSVSALVSVETTIANAGGQKQQAVLRSSILDKEGQERARYESSLVIGAKDTVVIPHALALEQPQLWSVETPDLYKLVSEIEINGQVIDRYTTTFGIRKIEYNPQKGFLLNGVQTKMKGVNLHHGAGSVGAAVPIDMWRRRFQVLKDMGCNAIRTAHNPVAEEFLDLCDEMGFLVMNEVFDEWTGGKVEYGYHKYFEEWSQRDLADFIRRDRNHPSVVMWSAGNEIGEQSRDGGHEILRPLIETFHRLDPTRPVTTGNDHIAADGRSAKLPFLNMLDIVGYNYVDRWHERRELYNIEDKINHPDWLMVGTESVSIYGVRSNYINPFDTTRIRPISTTSLIRAQELWKYISTHDYMIGDFMWTGIDYLGEARWPSKNASSGVIDLCGFPKDSYYFYQSQWTDAPMLHLFPHWNWSGKEGEVIPVMAFTNCDTVELFVNDKSFGQKAVQFPRPGNSGGWNRYDELPVAITTSDLYLTWDVPYTPGVLKAVGHCANGNRLEQTISTTGSPYAIRLTTDKGDISANRQDIAHITVEVVDREGRLVPTAANEISLQVNGPARLIGFDNGDPTDHTNMKSSDRKVFHGLALGIVQSEDRSGKVIVRATSPGLQAARVTIALFD